jgi:hypothetical protein
VIAVLAFCWAVLGAPTGKRLAPIMAELVPTLRRFDELVISDDTEMALLPGKQKGDPKMIFERRQATISSRRERSRLMAATTSRPMECSLIGIPAPTTGDPGE